MQHVPAWKRLGLKLKYAKDDAEPSGQAPAETIHSPLGSNNKRQSTFHPDETTSKPSKKQKVFKENGQTLSEANLKDDKSHSPSHPKVKNASVDRKATKGKHQTFDSEDEDPAEDDVRGRPRKASHRKSVTFTADTKAHDAESDSDGEAAEEEKEESSETPQATAPEQPASPDNKLSKKEKKRLKQQQKSSAASEGKNGDDRTTHVKKPKHQGTAEYVEYILQFYNEKTNWKFNKNKQTELLKHLFNPWRIPAQYDDALVAYIEGLQGARAQQRVIEDAEAVLKALIEKQERDVNVESMDSRTSRKAAYEAAVKREIEKVKQVGRSEYDEHQLLEMKRQAEKAKRADAVLAALLSKELEQPAAPPVSSAAPAAADGLSNGNEAEERKASKPDQKRKKRKARTQVSSDESSSSSSSDSSSSESESD
ncbi:hypothetical protein KC332_g11416 [Hortaea werneckii]|uniref:WKF domain-containing protein n=2 Tax=Hortaea werneckii TaxID=91943 RepID=A0A3M7I9X3_HORWE|nr:hypothetical protein KC342_g14880 [Hortaea werneckii]OTA26905.1 hypothetical protein BTJ68_11732 [Hortaea werneckii EXF-2000]KAI6823744.1 hypothetical protein KC358_g8450 [Hortaea werneckii]KAI6850795.1 hypothetical protein KC350_g1941 [Hortaea werneckii]KAI6942350.1 hypothetical protein KC341_g2307 [Hortaea werneckii]